MISFWQKLHTAEGGLRAPNQPDKHLITKYLLNIKPQTGIQQASPPAGTPLAHIFLVLILNILRSIMDLFIPILFLTACPVAGCSWLFLCALALIIWCRISSTCSQIPRKWFPEVSPPKFWIYHSFPGRTTTDNLSSCVFHTCLPVPRLTC